jgi:hypothetical protein
MLPPDEGWLTTTLPWTRLQATTTEGTRRIRVLSPAAGRCGHGRRAKWHTRRLCSRPREGKHMADLESVKAKLLMQIDGVLETKPGASKRLMELCSAYESLARATHPASSEQ